MKDWIANNKGKAILLLAAVFVVPHLAYQHMLDRKAAEKAEVLVDVDAKIPGLKLSLSKQGSEVVFQDGSRKFPEGVGIVTMTLEDHKANPERLSKQGIVLEDSDFPVIVFFNQSSFDATGDPAVVRRAKDGSEVFGLKNRVKRLRYIIPQRGGGYLAYLWDTNDPLKLDEATFYRDYMGIEPPPSLPPQDKLDKMSDEELQKLGIRRMTKEEYEKQGKTPKEPEKPAAVTAKTGIKATVNVVGGKEGVTPLASIPVMIFKGKVKQPFEAFPQDKAKVEEMLKALAVDSPLVTLTKTDKDGSFSVTLPTGIYTVIVEVQGKLRGNAFNPGVWPTCEVPAEGWLEYDFKVPR